MPPGGIGSVRVDLRELQREAIGDSVVAHGVGEPDRVLRRDCVEVFGVDVPTLLELSFVPPASLNPVAAPRGRHLFLDIADDILDALHLGVGKVRDLEHVGPAPREMAVGVEESRGRGAAREIDDPRILSRELSDLGIRADGENPTVLDRNRLGHGVLLVDGDHVSIHENRIGDEDLRDGPAAGSEDGEGEGEAGDARRLPHGR